MQVIILPSMINLLMHGDFGEIPDRNGINLEDTLKARSCYEETLKINPNYEKGEIALENLLSKI